MTKMDSIPWDIGNFQQIRRQLELAYWNQRLIIKVKDVSKVGCYLEPLSPVQDLVSTLILIKAVIFCLH